MGSAESWIGRAVRHLRHQAGWTQHGVECRGGLPGGKISRLERGRVARVPPALLRRLLVGLDTDLERLVEALETTRSPEDEGPAQYHRAVLDLAYEDRIPIDPQLSALWAAIDSLLLAALDVQISRVAAERRARTQKARARKKGKKVGKGGRRRKAKPSAKDPDPPPTPQQRRGRETNPSEGSTVAASESLPAAGTSHEGKG